ncbi:MAG: excinuclease ABC subunit UvrC [Rikenellaceae bacterium]|jgi:excinuclease ABC subunit C|nr:excinuclease ABC subunit UvrC [Rikenellaceae bacterium]
MTTPVADLLKEKATLLPTGPGVYQFLNAEGTVIYVGKAKNLRRRVSSYFMKRQDTDRKLQVMVRKIADLRHIVVASEGDALLLENNLIKELHPRYNILLKDDKTYPWICIRNEPFPRIVSTRRLEHDGSRYFGPYTSVWSQKQMLELIHSIYTIRTCSLDLHPKKIARGRYAVCLEYHLGNCLGPCMGRQLREAYDHNVADALDLFRGDTSAVVDRLEAAMGEAAAAFRFEEAARYKEKIELVRAFRSKTVIVSPTLTDLDVFSLVIDGGTGYCNFLRVKNGAVTGSLTIEMKLGVEDTAQDVLSYALTSIPERIEGPLSREVIVPFAPDFGDAFPKHTLTVPQRGDKLKLLQLSEQNVRVFRLEQLKQIEKKDPRARVDRVMGAMQRDLCLKEPPTHIECFDNSNIGGAFPVASCVVFRNGAPAKKEYRHFNIKTVVGANDFASMAEVVERRYTRLLEEGGDLPQLIVVDGGKGQLGFAYDKLCELGLIDRGVTVIGLAKRYEEIYFSLESESYFLDKSSETLRVLMHIRDEAHRFGITFHRQKRSNAFINSELNTIKGLGPKSAQALLKKFGSISKIKKTPMEALAQVIGPHRARLVKDALQE